MSNTTPRLGKGTIFVQKEVCKGCSFCVDFCPTHALVFSEAFNAKGYHFPVLGQESDCTGCDMCGLMCPDFAIHGARWTDLDARASLAQAR